MQHAKDVDPSTNGGTQQNVDASAFAYEIAEQLGLAEWLRFGHWWASPHTRYRHDSLLLPLRNTYEMIRPEIVDPC